MPKGITHKATDLKILWRARFPSYVMSIDSFEVFGAYPHSTRLVLISDKQKVMQCIPLNFKALSHLL
jgi:hypothetical protein